MDAVGLQVVSCTMRALCLILTFASSVGVLETLCALFSTYDLSTFVMVGVDDYGASFQYNARTVKFHFNNNCLGFLALIHRGIL